MGILLSSLTQLQEAPSQNLILLVGPPGAGKSTFCQQTILQNIAIDRPIIYVTTECGPSEAEKALKERGLEEIEPNMLSYVDAYNETVGVSVSDRPDTVRADCASLSSIDIAILKLQERIGKKGVLLIFDSLTSPYLFGGSEVLKFMRRTLSGFAAMGNSVLVLMDEGCAKEEDLGIMMSMANGIIRLEVENGSRVLNVVKHPVVKPTRIEIPTPKTWEKTVFDTKFWDPEMMSRFTKMLQSGDMREVQRHLSVNLFWPNFMKWSGVLWDPKRLPKISYEAWKQYGALTKDIFKFVPWHMKLLLKLFYRLPQNLSQPKDMKKLLKCMHACKRAM
jgi:KaiC/GvpD/RAD55 family RecA-like ATPase